jgi:hypothetical protein
MGFLSRSIPDQEWVKSARPIFELVKDSAAAFSEASRQEGVPHQSEAVGTVMLRFPSLLASLRRSPTPTSSEARKAKKDLQLALKDYLDAAKQANKLMVDLRDGLLERLTAGGMVGRAATGRITFQQTLYHEIAKKAERRLENARAFLERAE